MEKTTVGTPSIFEKITGLSILNFKSTKEVCAAIERRLGRKLKIRYHPSTLVPCRDVFPHMHVDMVSVDAQIDQICAEIDKAHKKT